MLFKRPMNVRISKLSLCASNNAFVVRSISKYGKLAAYMQTKKALLEAHKDNLEILTFMGRLNSIDLK